MIGYVGTRISPNQIRTHEGFLICTAPICRSGWQTYRRSELFPDSGSDEVIRVWRDPKEVTRPATIASVEGKPICLGHPAKMVDPSSFTWVTRGHAQNCRVADQLDANGNVQLVADLHFQDEAAINRIANGTRQLSCGYTFTVIPGPEPNTYAVENVRMNHIALVEAGRSGTSEITDAKDGEPMTIAERAEIETRFDRILACLEKLVSAKAHGEAEAGAEDSDLITPASAAHQPGEGKPRALGKVIPVAKSETPQHPIISGVETSGGAGSAKVDGAEEGDLVGPNHVVDSLRRLRPIIVASGDIGSITAFNTAMKSAKRGRVEQGQRLLSAFDRGRPSVVPGHFQDAVEAARARMLGQSAPERTRFCRSSIVSAKDRDEEPATFESTVAARRAELLAK